MMQTLMSNLCNKISILMISTVTMCASAFASESPITSVNMSEDEISNRINFIQSRFDQGNLHAQLWQYGWLSGFSASIAARTYIVTTEDESPARFDAAAGIFTSLSGVLSLILKPLPSSFAASKLNVMLETTAEQRRIKLQYAEQLLTASANEAKRRRGWAIQGVFFLEQLLAGLAIAVIDDRPKDALKIATMGMLASEIFTFTMPTQSITDLEEYSNQSFRHKPLLMSKKRWLLMPHSLGVSMRYFF